MYTGPTCPPPMTHLASRSGLDGMFSVFRVVQGLVVLKLSAFSVWPHF